MDVKLITAEPETFCRLCLTQHQVYYPLFESGGIQMLESITSMKISIDDPAPNFACQKCFLDLVKAYNIQQRLIAVETSLQTTFTTVKYEPVDVQPHQDDLPEQCEHEHQQKLITIKEEPIDSCDDQFDPNIQTDALPERSEHSKTIPNISLVKCRLCPKEIPIHEYRTTHLATHSDGFCEYCGTTFKHIHSLRRHVFSNHREPKRHCKKCNLKFNSLEAYDLHVKRVHTGKASYICETCGCEYFIKSALNRHIRTKHLGMDKWPCEFCGKKYRKSHLEQHKKVHSGEKPFVCEFCGRGFALKCNMNLHKTKVHGWKDAVNFKCVTCEKGFSSFLALSVHAKVHRKNRV